MPLRPDVTHLEFHIVGQLMLDVEVILGRVLATHVRLELSEQRVWTEHSPVHRLTPYWIQDTVHPGERRSTRMDWGKRSWSALVQKRFVEQGVKWECASSKWRLRAELFQHQLLNRVIEQSPPCTDAGLA